MQKIILSYVVIMLLLLVNMVSAQNHATPDDYGQNVPSPEYFGTVVLNNYSKQAGMAPVVFDHWLHRATFNCRICHVDIGFAMKSKASAIRAKDNIDGYFCGTCHDGKREVKGKEIFAACAVKYTKEEGKRCIRCHSDCTTGQRKYDYQTFTNNLPLLERNLIDWEKAEEEGLIHSIDTLAGVFYKTDAIQAQKDFSIESRSWRKSDVIFSHKKHVVWNGCAVCHPMIFPSSQKGTVEYSMFEIMDGEYCGACHVNVAFSVWLCYKCHEGPVQ
jgi:c(7)-type cytochrome triheme protein